MQRCNCTVRLAGDLGNTVAKVGASPAEIVILRHIHGQDAVIDIKPTGMDKTPHAVEREKLSYVYKREVVDFLFPGGFTPLPVSLKDIQVDVEEIPDLEDTSEAETSNETSDELPNTLAPSEALDPDDRELIDTIMAAKTKAELRDLAETNEVELEGVPDRMDDMKRAIVTGLFPNFKM